MAEFKVWMMKTVNTVGLMFLLISVYFIVSSKFMEEPPQFLGYEFMTILSGSMEPEIDRGSVILVKAIKNPTMLQEDDVVTFLSPRNHQLITHRIMAIHEEATYTEFTTKGDANLTPDAKPVPADLVVAKYQGVTFPYLGYIVNFMKSKWGMVIFLIIPAVYMMTSSFRYLQHAVAFSKEEG
jgi:signal peptidase